MVEKDISKEWQEKEDVEEEQKQINDGIDSFFSNFSGIKKVQ
jgi:hypothetical protein